MTHQPNRDVHGRFSAGSTGEAEISFEPGSDFWSEYRQARRLDDNGPGSPSWDASSGKRREAKPVRVSLHHLMNKTHDDRS